MTGAENSRGRLRLADATLVLQEHIRRFIRDKRELGDASRLEANLIELEYVETLREREAIVADNERARQEFNRALGLPPLVLPGTDGLAHRPLRLAPTALEQVMLDKAIDRQGAA